jgi:hypothetical protein
VQTSQQLEVQQPAVVKVVAASGLALAVPAAEQELQQAKQMVVAVAGQTLTAVGVGWASAALGWVD